MVNTIGKLVIPNLLKVSWRWDEKNQCRAIVSVNPVRPDSNSGTLTGTVTAKDANNKWVEVRPDMKGPVERYTPHWVGDNSGGPDKKMVNAISKVKVGDIVRVGWEYDIRRRLVKLEPAGGKPSAKSRSERKVTIDQVPKAVKKAILKEVGNGRLVDISEITEGTKKTYEIEMVKDGMEYDVLFDSKGNVLQKTSEGKKGG
jgi:uncharacterized membrane protein YkoI